MKRGHWRIPVLAAVIMGLLGAVPEEWAGAAVHALRGAALATIAALLGTALLRQNRIGPVIAFGALPLALIADRLAGQPRFELLSNLSAPIFLGAALVALGLVLRAPRRPLRALALVAAAALFARHEAAILLPAPAPAAERTQRFTVAAANIFWHNADPITALLELSADPEIDLLGLNEATSHLARAILTDPRLAERWPHRALHPLAIEEWNPDTWGLALLSRHPIDDLRLSAVGRDARRALGVLRARVTVNGRPLEVALTHAPRPRFGAESHAVRTHFFRELSEMQFSGPAVLLGDLNANGGSPLFRDLLARTGLLDTRQGHGLKTSWPGKPASIGIGLTLDHVLASQDFDVKARSTRGVRGADHRAAIATLAW